MQDLSVDNSKLSLHFSHISSPNFIEHFLQFLIEHFRHWKFLSPKI